VLRTNQSSAHKRNNEEGQALNAQTDRRHVLFICSRNQWRSPTAEQIWRRDSRLSVRSAGTNSGARKRVTEADIEWAELIFVMESKHRTRLVQDFGAILDDKELHVLDIPDEYTYMDSELVEILEHQIAALLGEP
jgi:predicted protein tyrosine phosphatase